jgi:hypothetical protein
MRIAERATPVAAAIAALSTLACCLPFGFLGAVGLAGASVWLQVGFAQLYVRRNQCQRRSPLSITLFWIAVAVVILVVLFPQVIASLIAG